jgi:hypothetical protein
MREDGYGQVAGGRRVPLAIGICAQPLSSSPARFASRPAAP